METQIKLMVDIMQDQIDVLEQTLKEYSEMQLTPEEKNDLRRRKKELSQLYKLLEKIKK